MSAQAPLFTVIIATYNWSSVLPYSTGSVLEQTFSNFELLVIGDGCTDDSESVVKAIPDSRVRWINLPTNTKHQSGPNNEGLRQARGEFIAYLGHDDLWLPHHLSSLLEALQFGADLAYAWTMIVRGDDSPQILVPYRPTYRPGLWIPPTSIAHRRKIPAQVGNWRHYRDLRVDPEVDLLQRVFDAGYSLTFLPRLTAIKFPAAQRRNVYKDRPSHEQAAWLKRIQQERDFEAVHLRNAFSVKIDKRKIEEDRSYSNSLLRFARRKYQRLARSVQKRVHQYSPRGKTIEARRRYKGLEN
jgi:glycosyltransferase involved in cell wall biosynthesis